MLRRRLVFVVVGLALAPAFAWGASVSRFIVTGDSRGSDNGINSEILTELVPAIIAENADLVLFNGDLVNDGYQAQLEYWVQTFYQPLAAAGVPVYACRGNHDKYADAWTTVFSPLLPGDGPAGQEYMTYSVAYDNALFILFDGVEIPQSYITSELSGKTQPHVFLCNHYPAFAVQHADCLAVFPESRDAFWDSIGDANGRAYFCGHDHFYDHARILDSRAHPIDQFVVGSAGAPLYDWGGTYADPRVQAVAHGKVNGYMVADINGTEVTLTFKQRVSPGVYEALDTYTYGTPFPMEDLPASRHWGLIATTVIVLVAFGLMGYAGQRKYRRLT